MDSVRWVIDSTGRFGYGTTNGLADDTRWYPVTIDVAPPPGSALESVSVRDSLRYSLVFPPLDTTWVTIVLPKSR